MSETYEPVLAALLALAGQAGASAPDGAPDAVLAHAARQFALAGRPADAAALLTAPVADEVASAFLRRLFGDPLLAEVVLAAHRGPAGFLNTAGRLVRGEIDPLAVLAAPERASPLLLPAAARAAILAGKAAVAPPLLEKLGRIEGDDAPFARLALARLLVHAGETDRGLKIALALADPDAFALALFDGYEATGRPEFLGLVLREAAPTTFTGRLLRFVALLLAERRLDPDGRGLPACLDLLKFRGAVDGRLRDALAAAETDRLLERVDALTALGLDGAAAACLKRLLAASRNNLEGLLKLSEVHERSGRHEAALAILDLIGRDSCGGRKPGTPQDPADATTAESEISRRAIENLLKLGRKDEALARLEAIIEGGAADRTTLETALALAVELRGDAESRPLATRLLAAAPNHPAALRVFARSAPPEEAEEAWLALIQAVPADEEAGGMIRRLRQMEKTRQVGNLEEKALEFAAKGDFGRAERDLREILELNPHQLTAYGSLAGILEKLGRPDDAFSVLRRGLSADPAVRQTDLWRRAGDLAHRIRNLAECHEILDTYRDARPSEIGHRLLLLAVKRELAYRGELQRGLAEEVEALDEELAAAPDDPALLLEKGYTLVFHPRYQKREDEGGRALIARAAEGFPSRPDVHAVAVAADLREGDSDAAIRRLGDMARRELPLGEAVRSVAEHFAEAGDASAALLWLRRLVEGAPGDPLAVDYARLETAEIAKAGQLLPASEHLKKLRKKDGAGGSAVPQGLLDLFRLGYGYIALPEAGRLFGDPYPMALDLFKQILSEDAGYLPAFGGLRDLALKAGSEMPELLQEADKHIRRALERLKGAARPPADTGFLYAVAAEIADVGFGRDRKQEAVNLYTTALKYDYFQPRVHHLLAGCLRFLKETRQAIAHYTVVIDLSGNRAMKDEAVRALNYLRRSGTL